MRITKRITVRSITGRTIRSNIRGNIRITISSTIMVNIRSTLRRTMRRIRGIEGIWDIVGHATPLTWVMGVYVCSCGVRSPSFECIYLFVLLSNLYLSYIYIYYV